MICRKCKRVMSLNELVAYASTHFAKLLFASGLAVYLAQAIKDYFSDKTRGFVDETMAGACNGLLMACPKCQKTNCWDPLPEAEQKSEEKQQVVLNKLEMVTNKPCD